MKKHASSDPKRGSEHPQPEIPARQPGEIPAKPSRDVPRTDRERAENEGMVSHPPAAPDESTTTNKAETAGELEGEGSYTAARRYREGLQRSMQQGDVEALGEEAAEALDGPEGKELRRAERAARRGRSAQHAHHSHSYH